MRKKIVLVIVVFLNTFGLISNSSAAMQNVAASRMADLPVDQHVHGQIMELREALSLNGEALKVHLEASRSVSG